MTVLEPVGVMPAHEPCSGCCIPKAWLFRLPAQPGGNTWTARTHVRADGTSGVIGEGANQFPMFVRRGHDRGRVTEYLDVHGRCFRRSSRTVQLGGSARAAIEYAGKLADITLSALVTRLEEHVPLDCSPPVRPVRWSGGVVIRHEAEKDRPRRVIFGRIGRDTKLGQTP